VLGVNSSSKSVAAIRNYYPKEGAIEFIFDPETNTFLVGGKGYHSGLASAINANTSRVVGGIFSRGPNGEIFTNEASGHFWQNWNPAVRQQFQTAMESYGLPVIHTIGH
jgi:hypothetical protein